MSESLLCSKCGAVLPASGICATCAADFLRGEPTCVPGEPFVPPTVEELAEKFPQLEIFELIGKGGMGAVYRARQRELDRIVALKILPPGIGDDPAFAERFAREARALAKLSHPNIVTLFEFGHAEDGPYFFLMEFVDGVNLRELLHAERISPREALEIVPQICDALQFAHDHGIVHRDIKPENILLDRRGRVKVADFGLAKLIGARGEEPGEGIAVDAELTGAGKILGTPSYMAPEQTAQPATVDHRADIYALGVVFYQMLTGELPEKQILPPSHKVRIDVRLDEVVLRALEKNPDRRYEQASVMKTQVEKIVNHEEGAFERPGNAPARSASHSRGRNLAVTGALLQLGQVIAMLMVVLSLARTFSTLGAKGVANVDQLAAAIGGVLVGAVVGMVIGFVGQVLLCLALTVAGYRARWFHWFLLIYSVPLIFCPPLGTGFAIFFLIYCLSRREEFDQPWVETSRPGLLPESVAEVRGAGFWRRAIAVLIDYTLVSLVVFPAILLLDGVLPKRVVVSVPFGLFTSERVVETHQKARKNGDGSITAIEERVVEKTVLGKWNYRYRETIAHNAGKDETSRQLIDPVSGRDLHALTTEGIVFWVLLLSWIASEASPVRASLGKVLVGIRVADAHGRRISLGRSAGRNAAKLISAISLFIGFLMAGWTKRKQAMHDLIADCEVVVSPSEVRRSTGRFAGAGASLVLCTLLVTTIAGLGLCFGKSESLLKDSRETDTSADSAVKSWLGLMDGGEYAEAWQAAAPSFQEAVTQDDWAAKSRQIRQPLGRVISRKMTSSQHLNALPGMPDGSYFVAEFQTSFADLPAATETATFALDPAGGGWQAISYFIHPRAEAGDKLAAPALPKTDAERAAVTAAESWLAGIDAGKYAESWPVATGLFRAAVTQPQWVAAMESFRAPLGALVRRTLRAAQMETNLPGAPDGEYVVMQFDTSFAAKKTAVETVTFMREKDGSWRAAGYFIK